MPVNNKSHIELCQNECNNTAEYVVYIEGDKPPMTTQVKRVCADCLQKLGPGLIDYWTIAQWETDHAKR